MTPLLTDPLTLPYGLTLPNRLVRTPPRAVPGQRRGRRRAGAHRQRHGRPTAAPTFVQLSHPGRQVTRFIQPHLPELGLLLQDAGVDLIEVSGGNYERPMMVGPDATGAELRSTHESPFWEAAASLSAAVDVPVVLTGGFRPRAEVDRALAAGVCAMVGAGDACSAAGAGWHRLQLVRTATGRQPLLRLPALAERAAAPQSVAGPPSRES